MRFSRPLATSLLLPLRASLEYARHRRSLRPPLQHCAGGDISSAGGDAVADFINLDAAATASSAATASASAASSAATASASAASSVAVEDLRSEQFVHALNRKRLTSSFAAP